MGEPIEKLHLLECKGLSIFEQLQLEEALLRAGKDNWLILNQESSNAVVMGISGKPELLVEGEELKKKEVPLIRRYSGGGTVVIDSETIFVSLISNSFSNTANALSPEKLMQWSGVLYERVFGEVGFVLKDNDYVIGEKKCGGNAQYLCKDRFVHHTSFLWDFSPEMMAILKHPPKEPAYRQGRSHLDFLTPLKEHFKDKDDFLEKVKHAFRHHYEVIEGCLEEARLHLDLPHRKASELLIRPN